VTPTVTMIKTTPKIGMPTHANIVGTISTGMGTHICPVRNESKDATKARYVTVRLQSRSRQLELIEKME